MKEGIRHLPRYRLLRLLKEHALTQREVGRRAGYSEGYVSRVIARLAPRNPHSEAVWRVLEEALK